MPHCSPFHLKRVKEAANDPKIPTTKKTPLFSQPCLCDQPPYTRLHCAALAYLILDAFISHPAALENIVLGFEFGSYLFFCGSDSEFGVSPLQTEFMMWFRSFDIIYLAYAHREACNRLHAACCIYCMLYVLLSACLIPLHSVSKVDSTSTFWALRA